MNQRVEGILLQLYRRNRASCKLQGWSADQYNPAEFRPGSKNARTEEDIVQYWVKVVFVDNQELLVKDAVRHTISDDMEVLEVDSAKEVIIIPMKQIKYLACDATVFASKKPA